MDGLSPRSSQSPSPCDRILVTSALPYANGPIHLGHLVEYLQTDIWVRFQKLRGNRCVYVCADDTHGTAIMIRARQEGIGEEELIARMQQAHLADFAGFQIEFDNYGSTNSPENRHYCEEIWAALRKADLVSQKEVTQLYDPVAGTFLADRFVQGDLSRSARPPDQYGDSCEKCGEHYSPTDLIDPVSTLSGREARDRARPATCSSTSSGCTASWTSGSTDERGVAARDGQLPEGPFPRRAAARLGRLAAGAVFRLRDSRQPGQLLVRLVRRPDRLPGLDAAVVRRATASGSTTGGGARQTEVHHFIGKDITYFHTLFWPAMLKTAGFSLPEKVHIHGFLTVSGEKMSKSKGTFVQASTYLEHLDPAYLRYYYASKLTSRRGRPRSEPRRVRRPRSTPTWWATW